MNFNNNKHFRNYFLCNLSLYQIPCIYLSSELWLKPVGIHTNKGLRSSQACSPSWLKRSVRPQEWLESYQRKYFEWEFSIQRDFVAKNCFTISVDYFNVMEYSSPFRLRQRCWFANRIFKE